MSLKVVITGSTYAGKTTLVDALAEQGFSTVPEAGMQVIETLSLRWGIARQKQWRAQNPAEFYTLVAERQMRLEMECAEGAQKKGIVFHDRGLHDCIAFCRLANIETPQRILDLAARASYDLIFVCEVLSDFDCREREGRSLSKALSMRLGELVEEVYTEYGFATAFIRRDRTGPRLAYIKNCLERFFSLSISLNALPH